MYLELYDPHVPTAHYQTWAAKVRQHLASWDYGDTTEAELASVYGLGRPPRWSAARIIERRQA